MTSSHKSAFDCKKYSHIGIIDGLCNEYDDMGLRVGNNFYSLLNGVLEDYGPADDRCDGCDTTEEECNVILNDLGEIINWITKKVPSQEICEKLHYCNSSIILT